MPPRRRFSLDPTRMLAVRPLPAALSFGTSVFLHVLALVPLLLLSWLVQPQVVDDEDATPYAEGDAPDGEGELVDDAVLTVTVLNTPMDWDATTIQPTPAPAPDAAAAPPTPAAPTRDKATQAQKPDDTKSADGARAQDAAAQGDVEAGQSTGDGTPNPMAQKSSKGKGKPCPVNADVVRLETWKWGIERSLVERYANDISAAEKLARITANNTADGKPNGFKLGLPRCSVLRQAGLRTGDIVRDVNGRKIHNILQAVAAYFTLRKEKDFVVHIQRKNQLVTLWYRVDKNAAHGKTPYVPVGEPE